MDGKKAKTRRSTKGEESKSQNTETNGNGRETEEGKENWMLSVFNLSSVVLWLVVTELAGPHIIFVHLFYHVMSWDQYLP